MPYNIGGVELRTKSDISDRCRSILRETPDNSVVSQNNSEFLFALFKYHDEWNHKSKGGIKEISTQTTEHGTRCFVLVKRDSSRTDISFPHSIKHIPTKRTKPLMPQGLLDYKSAARTAIKFQIYSFRDKALAQKVVCPYTGEALNRSNCAIDHTPPNTFDKILFEFSLNVLINPLEVEVASREGVIAEFTDKNIEAEWQKHHQTNATLRAISKIGNLQLSKVSVPWEEIL